MVWFPRLCADITMSDWQEERLRRGDDLRLQMALEESRREKSKPEEVCVLRIESKSVFTSMLRTYPTRKITKSLPLIIA